MDYEREDKAALCRATLALAKAEAARAGATVAHTMGGNVPLADLLSSGVPWARGGWEFQPGDPHDQRDGRIGAIVEYGGTRCAAFPVFYAVHKA